MHIKEIVEARKNPELNPKESVNKQLKDLYDATTDTIPGSNIKNLFVSFTDLDKLGINPTSKYNTPIGIYAYPAKYVLNKIGKKDSTEKLPFAGDKPWINIFRANGNIVDLKNIDSSEYREYLKTLGAEFIDKKIPAKDYIHLYNEARMGSTNKTYKGILWYFTKLLADYIDQQTVDKTKLNTRTVAKSASVIWQSILRKTLKIDGMIDNGNRIIHENEPTQAVFFNPAAIEIVKRIPNKYNPVTMRARNEYGDQRKRLITNALEDLRKYLSRNQNSSIEYINNYLLVRDGKLIKYLPKETRIKLLDYNPNLLKYLTRISKEEFQTAVLKAPDILYSTQVDWFKYITPEDFLDVYQTFLTKHSMFFSKPTLFTSMFVRKIYSKFANTPFIKKFIYTTLQLAPEAILTFIEQYDYPELANMKNIDFAIDRAISISPKRGQDLISALQQSIESRKSVLTKIMGIDILRLLK